MKFDSPLTVWRPENLGTTLAPRASASQAPLDITRCHAEICSGVGVHSVWMQCLHRPTTQRIFHGAEDLPCCGKHAKVYDKELAKHEAHVARNTKRATLVARCEVLIAKGVECWPMSVQDTRQVVIDIGTLERLVAAAK